MVGAQDLTPCPAPVPKNQIVPGMIGEGWTVVKGTTPKPFRVEVLGVLKDGIGAGKDMVIFEASDLPAPADQVIANGGGIWEGISGSPVYVNGQLLGAISYGITYAPSPIGGLTPAADMMDVLNASSAGQAKASSAAATKVTLTTAQRKAFSARATAAVPAGLQQLRMPLSVNGLSGKWLTRLQKAFDRSGRPVVVYAGGKASKPVKPAAAVPGPGSNFGLVATYGDLTMGGVGTTTAVCGNKVLAFGHYASFAGKVSFGATAATSLGIVKDASGGSYKLANIGDTFGTVDQDRLTAVRAIVGKLPATTPVTSTITNLDNGKVRTGTTQVADPDYTAVASLLGPYYNYQSTFDKVGKGLASTTWTIKGTRAGGKAFTVSRSNVWSDLTDPTEDAVYEVADAVDSLLTNEYEPVKITSVNFKSSVTSTYDRNRITKVAISVNGGKYKEVPIITVKPKAKLKVRVTMRGYQSSKDRNVVLSLKVAKRYAKQTGTLKVQGGLSANSGYDDDSFVCMFMDCKDDSNGSLNEVISDITSPPANNAVRADLDFDENADGEFSTDAKTSATVPVSGQKTIVIKVKKK